MSIRTPVDEIIYIDRVTKDQCIDGEWQDVDEEVTPERRYHTDLTSVVYHVESYADEVEWAEPGLINIYQTASHREDIDEFLYQVRVYRLKLGEPCEGDLPDISEDDMIPF